MGPPRWGRGCAEAGNGDIGRAAAASNCAALLPTRSTDAGLVDEGWAEGYNRVKHGNNEEVVKEVNYCRS